MDRAELSALLKTLVAARRGDGAEGAEGPEGAGGGGGGAVSWLELDGVLAAFDADGDGLIDEDEWVARLGQLPALTSFLAAHVNPRTGKLNEVAPAAPAQVDAPAPAAAAE